MAGEGEDITVICSSWSARNMRQTPGSVEGRCAGCRRRLTIGRAGQRVEPDPGFEKRYMCIRCAQAESPDAHAEPVPGALREAAQVIGPVNAIVAGSEMKRIRLGDFKPEDIDG